MFSDSWVFKTIFESSIFDTPLGQRLVKIETIKDIFITPRKKYFRVFLLDANHNASMHDLIKTELISNWFDLIENFSSLLYYIF